MFLLALVAVLFASGVGIARWGHDDEVTVATVPGLPAPTTPATGDAGSGGPVGGADHTQTLLRGVPQEGLTLGSSDITIVEFVDFQCPFCRAHQLEVAPAAIEQVVKTGRARLMMVPLAFLGPDSDNARHVFLKLSERNLGWQFADLMFRNQGAEGTGYVTQRYLQKLVAAIPGTTAADADPTPNAYSERWANAADALASTGAIPGTPTFAVGYTGQDVRKYAIVGADWNAAINLAAVLAQGGTPGTSPGTPGTTPGTPPGATPTTPVPRFQPGQRITT